MKTTYKLRINNSYLVLACLLFLLTTSWSCFAAKTSHTFNSELLTSVSLANDYFTTISHSYGKIENIDSLSYEEWKEVEEKTDDTNHFFTSTSLTATNDDRYTSSINSNKRHNKTIVKRVPFYILFSSWRIHLL